ncbi:MAG: hypothetical protein WBU92_08875 [Candidatus Dormiibacterota bacterium]
MSAGRLLVVAVIAFLSVSAVADVVTSIGTVGKSGGPPKAQLDGSLGSSVLTVGRPARLTFGLFLASGGAMDPACIGANLTPEFKVVQVTFLNAPGSSWAGNESCGQILETNSTIPIVITVVPLHPGDFTIAALPKVRDRTVGSGPSGQVSVRP